MVKRSFKIFFLILASTHFYCFSQSGTIDEKKEELNLIQQEISSLETLLKEKSKQERANNTTLENYNKQNHLINKVLGNLRKQQKDIQKKIDNTKRDIINTENKIKQLQENYSKYLVAVYKKGRVSELESLLDVGSIQQAVYRIHYLKKFSENRKKDLVKLQESKQTLKQSRDELEGEKIELAVVLSQKQIEEKQLRNKLNERKNILSSIKKDKTELKKSLNSKKEAQQKIQGLIVQLVEKEEKRKRELELKQNQLLASGENNIVEESGTIEKNVGDEYNFITSTFESFSDLKGKMNWPLHKGKIFRSFGENRNKKLNTVTINYGVDIEAAKDKNVKCVADGIVSAIDWLPGYGSVIIITHKENYRTVYGHLEEIFVEEGERVRAGTVLAKVGESVDGLVLHFEIWNSRIYQNPSDWLAKK